MTPCPKGSIVVIFDNCQYVHILLDTVTFQMPTYQFKTSIYAFTYCFAMLSFVAYFFLQAIMAEGKQHALAVGITSMSTEEM